VKIDTMRISARWNLRLQPIPRKWKNVREVLFGGAALYRHPYRDSFVFAYHEVTWRSHRKYDGRVCDDGISVRTNEHHGRTPKISRHAAMRRLDLGAEHREGSLETERGWRSTTNRYTYLSTCMREQTVSSGLDREEITEISEFSYFHVSYMRCDHDSILSTVI